MHLAKMAEKSMVLPIHLAEMAEKHGFSHTPEKNMMRLTKKVWKIMEMNPFVFTCMGTPLGIFYCTFFFLKGGNF